MRRRRDDDDDHDDDDDDADDDDDHDVLRPSWQTEEFRTRPKASLFTARFRGQLLVGVGVVTLQQITGACHLLEHGSCMQHQVTFCNGAVSLCVHNYDHRGYA
jgi:hypothetical protein